MASKCDYEALRRASVRQSETCYRSWPAWLLSLLFSLTVTPGPATAEIIKSPADQRQYRSLQLDNGLRVLLVSDPQAAVAAAALNVAVGSALDPEQRLGLAHLLEHMLFMGTASYPQAGGFDAFLSAHGGRSNAHTGLNQTSYHFSIEPARLGLALARFGEFFSAPLLPAALVAGEARVVDAEYRSRRSDDDWRELHAFKRALNPAHPLARFAVGSAATLLEHTAPAVLAGELGEFFRRYYRAPAMTLAVLGAQPPAQLETWVRRAFAALASDPPTTAVPGFEQPLFVPGSLPARLDVAALKQRRLLTLRFPIPSSNNYFLTKPARYVAQLIGAEGPGGLAERLRARGWADAVSAKRERAGPTQAVFKISLRLSTAGLRRLDAVIETVFGYLSLLRRFDLGPARRLFDDQRRLAELAFRFREAIDPQRYVQLLAANLHSYPKPYLLFGSYAMERFEPALIKQVLTRLKPDNVLLTVTAPAAELGELKAREPWFGAAYRLTPLVAPSESGDDGFRLPAGNPFVPADLNLKQLPEADLAEADAAGGPVKIDLRPDFQLWYRQDRQFRVPRANFFLSLRSPYTNASPAQAALTKLYVKLVNEQLKAIIQPARQAGLELQLYPHSVGLSLKLSGYNDKQPLLLEQALEALSRPQFDQHAFALGKEALLHGLANVERIRPYRRALLEVKNLLLAGQWSAAEQHAALTGLQADDLRGFVPQLLASAQLVGLAHGNLLREDALALGRQVSQALLPATATATAAAAVDVVPLVAGRLPLRRLAGVDDDSVLVNYYQGDDTRPETRASFDLLARLLAGPFYHDLRTEKQLGYIVSAASMPLDETPGLALVVQSPSAGPARLQDHVERFLGDFQRQLGAMDDATFQAHRQGLLAQLQRLPKTLSERSADYWRTITGRQANFVERERRLSALTGLDRSAIQDVFRQLLAPAQRRRLAVYVRGQAHAVANGGTTPDDDAAVLVKDWRELLKLSL